MPRPTLYEFAGGERAFVALARAHHARCLADPELNHPFSKQNLNPEHVERLGLYWAEVLGGPTLFTERGTGHRDMLAMHSGQGAMDDLGRRFVACFADSFDEAGLPEDAEFRAALTSYMQWAVAEVLSHEDPDTIPGVAPMPRWDWDGLVTD